MSTSELFDAERFVFETGITPLMVAAASGNVVAASRLLEAGSNPNVQCNCGFSALMIATWNRHPEMVSLLIAADGSNINLQDYSFGLSALMIPAVNQFKGDAALLASKDQCTISLLAGSNGVDLNLKDFSGQTALTKATLNKKAGMVRILIKNGATVDLEGQQPPSRLGNHGHKDTFATDPLIIVQSNEVWMPVNQILSFQSSSNPNATFGNKPIKRDYSWEPFGSQILEFNHNRGEMLIFIGVVVFAARLLWKITLDRHYHEKASEDNSPQLVLRGGVPRMLQGKYSQVEGGCSREPKWPKNLRGEFEFCHKSNEGRSAQCQHLASAGGRMLQAQEAPHDLFCPITMELFVDPVVAADGECYERAAIEHWIVEKQALLAQSELELREMPECERAKQIVAMGLCSPMGHGKLQHTALTPARNIKRQSDQWR